MVGETVSMVQAHSYLRTVSGERAPIHGTMMLDITIGSKTFHQKVWVADVVDECLLGLDFLVSHECQVDLKDGILYIGGEEVPLAKPGAALSEPRCFRAVTSRTVSVAPYSEAILCTQVVGLGGDERWGIVEAAGSSGQVVEGVLVGRTLVDLQQPEVPVRVMNLSDQPRTISKGTDLAACEELCSVQPFRPHKGSALDEMPPHLAELYEKSIEGLTQAEAEQVRKLLVEYADVFSRGSEDLGRTDLVKHHIRTGDAIPIKQPPRRLPMTLREEAKKAVEEMVQQKVIEPAEGPWSSPVVLVRKKDGGIRFCVDYRRLNAVTHKDSYPLPRIDETLEALGGSEWFSTLDLKSGYWQVELAEEDREKSAFSAGAGLWQFTVMPFGLCNAPATFERLMDRVLKGVELSTALVYLDDILVHAKSFETHIVKLKVVLERLRKAGLKLSPKKCSLLRRQVRYLGHILSQHGVTVDGEKIQVVLDWSTPTAVKQVRSFLGLCSYYRRFVKGFADIARPLHRLTEKGQSFQWGEEEAAAFNQLKQSLATAPVLAYPQIGARYILDTDASGHGIGAVLSQVQEGEEHPVAYFSRVLSRAERSYCTTRIELLALVKSVQHFRPHLYGVKFTIRTDHAALKWLLSFREPEGQIARWIQQLQEYNFEVEHRPGKQHGNADALSRRPCWKDACKHCQRVEEKSQENLDIRCRAVPHVTVFGNDPAVMRQAQLEDQDICPILCLKEVSSQKPAWCDVSIQSQDAKLYWAQWESLVLLEGVLYRQWESPIGDWVVNQLILPRKFREDVLTQLHDSHSGGHLGVNKTLGKVRERFYWAQCSADVRRWCRNCDLCASRRGPPRKTRAPMKQHNVGAPLERVAIDVLGPLPESASGNRYLLIVQDYFTKWVEAYPLPNQEARTVAQVLVEEFIARFGVPMALHSDQGRNFESFVFAEMCRLMGIHKTRTTPLHPQSDGMVERFNRTLESQLSKFVNEHQDDWDECVPLLLMAYRTSVHETTGCTPAEMMLGRDLRLPVDLIYGRPEEECPSLATEYVESLQDRLEQVHSFARPRMQMQSDRMKAYYDLLQPAARSLKEGAAVWLYNPQRKKGRSPKLQRAWEGPYIIVKVINDLVFRIQRTPRTKPKVVHRNRLWLYSGDDPPTWFETPLEQESLVDSDGPDAEGSDPVNAGELPVIDSPGITDIPAVEPVETETDSEEDPGSRDEEDSPTTIAAGRYPRRVRKPKVPWTPSSRILLGTNKPEEGGKCRGDLFSSEHLDMGTN